jgi:hypothetical protein
VPPSPPIQQCGPSPRVVCRKRNLADCQFKSATSGHTGSLGEVSKQEVENVFFGDEKNVKDKSVE